MKRYFRSGIALLLTLSMVLGTGTVAFAQEPETSDVEAEIQAILDEAAELVEDSVTEEDSEETIVAYNEVAYCCDDEEVYGYYPTADSKYVSLGDSTVTGLALEGYGNYGYQVKVPEAYTSLLTKELHLDVDSQFTQLACGGFRVEDVRFLLDENYNGDAYARGETVDTLNDHCGGLEEARRTFKEEVSGADLVTVGMGGNNFGTSLTVQMNRLLAGEEMYELEWDLYFDDGVIDAIKNVLNGLNELLVKVGVDQKEADNAVAMVECALYGYAGFAFNFAETLNEVHKLSPEALVVVVGMYNSMDGVYLDLGDITLDLGGLIGKLAEFGNLHYKTYAKITEDTVYVDAFDTTTFGAEEIEAGLIDPILDFYMEYMGVNSGRATHPSAAGHEYIKNQIEKAINAAPRDHEYEECVEVDADTHTQTCTITGCEFMNVEEHIYVDASDTTCEKCVYVREITEVTPDEDESETDKPEVNEPETDEPGTEKPEIEKPGVSAKPVKPAKLNIFGWIKNYTIKPLWNGLCNWFTKLWR